MIEFRRDEKTGIVYAYKDGKKVGSVSTMGDNIDDDVNKDKKKAGEKNGKNGRV